LTAARTLGFHGQPTSSDDHPAGFERGVQTGRVSAAELAGSAEGDPLPLDSASPRAAARALAGDALDGEIVDHTERPVRELFHPPAHIPQGWEHVRIEEVRRPEVGVAVGIPGVEASCGDGHVHLGAGGLLEVEGHRAGHDAEAALDRGNHEVADAELDIGVGRIDGPGVPDTVLLVLSYLGPGFDKVVTIKR
jgi:hypothetical protein